MEDLRYNPPEAAVPDVDVDADQPVPAAVPDNKLRQR